MGRPRFRGRRQRGVPVAKQGAPCTHPARPADRSRDAAPRPLPALVVHRSRRPARSGVSARSRGDDPHHSRMPALPRAPVLGAGQARPGRGARPLSRPARAARCHGARGWRGRARPRRRGPPASAVSISSTPASARYSGPRRDRGARRKATSPSSAARARSRPRVHRSAEPRPASLARHPEPPRTSARFSPRRGKVGDRRRATRSSKVRRPLGAQGASEPGPVGTQLGEG